MFTSGESLRVVAVPFRCVIVSSSSLSPALPTRGFLLSGGQKLGFLLRGALGRRSVRQPLIDVGFKPNPRIGPEIKSARESVALDQMAKLFPIRDDATRFEVFKFDESFRVAGLVSLAFFRTVVDVFDLQIVFDIGRLDQHT